MFAEADRDSAPEVSWFLPLSLPAPNDFLHDTVMIQDCHKRRKENYRRQHLESEKSRTGIDKQTAIGADKLAACSNRSNRQESVYQIAENNSAPLSNNLIWSV
jgi:hypothetical protein